MIIYKVTNINNGKIYIGQTIISMRERKSCHIRRSLNKNITSHFHRSIRKHGIDSFKWEIIDNALSREELNKKEKYWIKHFDSLNNKKGYNMTSGGDSPAMREETRNRLSLIQKGKKITPEQSKARSERMKGKGNHFYGRSHSKETISKISKSRIGKGKGQTDLQKKNCRHNGEKNGNSSITKEIAIKIKEMIRDGYRNCEIQKTLNVTKNTLQCIKSGKTWKWLEIC